MATRTRFVTNTRTENYNHLTNCILTDIDSRYSIACLILREGCAQGFYFFCREDSIIILAVFVRGTSSVEDYLRNNRLEVYIDQWQFVGVQKAHLELLCRYHLHHRLQSRALISKCIDEICVFWSRVI